MVGSGVGVSVATGVGVTVTATDSSGSSPPKKLHADINTDADIVSAKSASILLFFITSSLK